MKFCPYRKYDDAIENISEHLNAELISGKLDFQRTSVRTKSTQGVLEKKLSARLSIFSKTHMQNIDECKEEGMIFEISYMI